MINDFINKVIEENIGEGKRVLKVDQIGGGCINHTVKVVTTEEVYFLKYNESIEDMFEKEARGLELLSKCQALRLPEVYGFGTVNGIGYLLLEFIKKGPQNKQYWTQFGSGLATLHRECSDSFFGLDHNNYIGRLVQHNTYHEDWVNFFVSERLSPQIKLGRDNGLINHDLVRDFEILINHLPQLFPEEKPALIHGDLWSGNIISTADNLPCIFDPAVYHGHREAEISFTKLFGGFDKSFYQAYNESYPLENGFQERIDLYNLYPLLVHVNLFGSSYLSGIKSTLSKFT